MESATYLQRLPQAEEFARRFEELSNGNPLRDGQAELINDPSSVKWAALVTGYGKTVAAIGCFWVAREAGQVNRCLYIVPGRDLRQQTMSSIQRIEGTPISIGAPYSIVRPETAVLREHRHNLKTVFIATIHSVASDPEFYADLMETGRWMVVADEFHRYSLEESARWGEALKRLPYDMMVGLSATPDRTDNGETLFSHIEPTVHVSLARAKDEDAIRKLQARRMHYNIEVINVDCEPIELTTEDLANPKGLDERLTRERLKFSDKYVSHMLMMAMNELQAKRLYNEKYKALVAAASCKHAEYVANLINKLDTGLAADWVGGGNFGRPDDENDAVMARFKTGDLPVLVQVNKAGEGFDVPECAVLVILRTMYPSVQLTQLVGRVLRRVDGMDSTQDVGCVFYSADNPGGSHIDEICQLITPEAFGRDGEAGDSPKPREPGEIPPWDDLPSVFIRSVNYDRDDLIQYLGDRGFQMAANEIISTVFQVPVSYDQLDEYQQKNVDNIMTRAFMRKQTGDIERQQEETYRKRLNVARKEVVASALKAGSGGSNFPKSIAGDMKQRLSRRAIEVFGNPASALTEQEAKAQFEWMRGIQKHIESTKEVPEWLMP